MEVGRGLALKTGEFAEDSEVTTPAAAPNTSSAPTVDSRTSETTSAVCLPVSIDQVLAPSESMRFRLAAIIPTKLATSSRPGSDTRIRRGAPAPVRSMVRTASLLTNTRSSPI